MQDRIAGDVLKPHKMGKTNFLKKSPILDGKKVQALPFIIAWLFALYLLKNTHNTALISCIDWLMIEDAHLYAAFKHTARLYQLAAY